MSMRTEIRYERNFDTLLFDSIEMLFRSLDPETGMDFSQTLGRSSMLNSILLLELSANICIESLELEGSVFNEIDQFSILDKFDYFLTASSSDVKSLRGAYEFEVLEELDSFRGGCMYLRPHRIEMKIEGDSGIGKMDTTSLLDISENPKGWDADAALKTMQEVHSFLKYFFGHECMFSSKKVGSFLLSDSETPGTGEYPAPHFYKATRKELKDMGVDLSYIELAWS